MPMILSSDRARINYVERGAGSPILLIGGWTMSTPWWRKQLAGLDDGHRVVAMDPRAYGESENVSYGHRIARHAADVRDLLEALDLRQVTAVGWSSGANVLLSHWELFGSERIARIVHVDQSPKCLNDGDWQLGFGTEAEATAFLDSYAADPRATANGLIDAMFAEPPGETDRTWMVEEMLKIPPDLAIQFEWDHLRADWRDIVPTVRVPVLVTTGRHSRIFPWKSGEWLVEALPFGKQVMFELSGHCPFLEEPDRFNAEVATFASQF